MDKSLVPMILALLFAGVTAFSSVYIRVNLPKETDGRPPPRAKGRGRQILQQQIIVGSLIAIIWYFGDFSQYEFGVSRMIPPILAFGIGFLVYFAVLLVVELVSYFAGIRDRLHDFSFETMRFIWPRERSQKLLAIVAVCLLNPFTEEIIYRGVLVYYLGDKTGSFAVAVLIGLTFSVLAHAYQGLWLAPFHLLFHGTAIALIFSPLGLFGCIGMHFAGDLVPVAMLRRNMLAWKERKQVKSKKALF